ncbi:L10-interacting MYB domain-containing protein-like [Neltuma alba]|uniref:L10-interacting MYB domain-containing protein-like n=1 Tax=Neltuma alba TaxID=207710 RepID=UPI0010A560F4|nr:L10-interacting MYB domain-containing protein-like [Prosopis alba]
MSGESQKTKATCDLKTTEYFIQACLTRIYKGERSGTTLTKRGWKAVIAEFNCQSGSNYDRSRLKNKWDCLKKEWQAWDKLFAKETGLGWDSENNTVDAPNEWWERKILEGSGDSENASGEAAEKIANINLNASQGSSSKVCGGKRNNDVASGKTKKVKGLASSRIADAITLIAESCRARVDGVPGTSIGEVMAELLTIEDVANDPEFHAKCCQLMMLKPAREMFIALRDVADKRLNWLQHAAYNPLPYEDI